MSSESMDLTNMLKDVNQVLHSHLSNLLNPILLEKQTINQVLLNMPYVKQLDEQNQALRKKLVTLQSEYNVTQTSLREKDAIIKELSEKLEQLGSGTVKLEVKELKEEDAIKLEITELGNQKEEAVVLENTKHKNCKVKIATQANLNYFNSLMQSDDDESDEEGSTEDEDDDDDDDANGDISETDMFKMSENRWISATTGKIYKKDDVGAFGLFEKSDDEEQENSIVCDVAGPEGDMGPASHDGAPGTPIQSEEEAEEEAEEEEEGGEDAAENEKEEDEDADEDEESEEEDEDDEDDEEDEDMEVEEIVIDNETYLTDSQENGLIYKCDDNGEILEDKDGDWVQAGYFKDGISFFI